MNCRYALGGDEHIFVEVNEAMSLKAFFVSLAITNAVREARIDGVTEICPANASFQIKFNPDVIAPRTLLAELKAMEAVSDAAPNRDWTRESSKFRSSTRIPGQTKR